MVCAADGRVLPHVFIAENVAISSLNKSDPTSVVSCLSYNLSNDGTELLVYVAQTDEPDLKGIRLKREPGCLICTVLTPASLTTSV